MISRKGAKAQRETQHYHTGRREFLRGTVRWLLTALGVAGIGALAAKPGRCDRAFACRACPALRGCGLPQAQEFHAKAQRRKDSTGH